MILRYTLMLLLLLISSESINARCIVPPPPKTAFLDAKSVFVGKIIEITSLSVPDPELPPGVINLEQPIKVRVKVERVYRGVEDDEIEVETMTGGPDWGVNFKLNETYVIYAHKKDKKKKSLIVYGCGRTGLITQAEEDLEFLNGLNESK